MQCKPPVTDMMLNFPRSGHPGGSHSKVHALITTLLGALYVWPNLTELCCLTGTSDSEELRKRLPHEAGVAALADIDFGPRVEGEGRHIRFSCASSTDTIRSGVARVADWVQKNRK